MTVSLRKTTDQFFVFLWIDELPPAPESLAAVS
jgi:hypothetical protein